MKKARKLTGLLALLALCACASDRGTTTGTAGEGTTGTGTSGTTGGTTGAGTASQVDCSTVRCAACPTGQHPALKPPDCCRCIPD